MNKIIKMISVIMCSICLVFTLTACGEKEQNKKAYVKGFEPITEIKEGQPNIYLITKVLDNKYWNVMVDCIARAGEENGCNIYFSGSEFEYQWETQVILLDKAMEAGADAIIVAPDNSAQLSVPLNEIYETGIPVVLIDTTITSDSYDVCFMTDNLYAGEQAAMEMLKQLKNSGCKEDEKLCVGIQAGSSTSQTITERLVGFTQYWTDHAPKQWTIIEDVVVNNGDIDYAVKRTEDYFKDYPEIKGLFGCNNGSTVGISKAVYDNNRTDIVVVGFDYSDEMARLIDDSQYIASTMLQKQNQMGTLSVKTVLRLLDGEVIYEKFTDTGVVVVNTDTINDADIQEILSFN